jgi:hypothetical protein
MKDLHNNIDVRRAIAPVSVADNTAAVSQIIDRQGFESLEFVIQTGSIADAYATFAVTVDDGDDSALGDAAAVASKYLLGTTALAGFNFGDDNKVKKIGYVGNKRYIRLTITPTNNASAALISAVAVLGCPFNAPTANPPA